MVIKQSTAVVAGIMPDYARAGGVLNRYGTYTVATTQLAANQTIEMVPIPAGARIINMGVKLATAKSDCHLDVGDGGDIDRFFDGVDGAADDSWALFGDGTSNGHNYQYTVEDTIDIFVKESAMGVGTRVDLNVQYVMGNIADEA